MTIVVLMGVTGSGKTTVGQMLAQRFGWSFLDADDFHPEANIAKMRAGVALGDADRWPWLDALNARLRQCRAAGANAVLACSALKRVYRERIVAGLPDTHWVHLAGSFEQIGTRLQQRQGHYMSPSLLRSQFDTLEAPDDALALDIAATPEALADAIAVGFGLTPTAPPSAA